MREGIGALIRIAFGPAAAVVLLVGTPAWAAPGDLDSSFSGDGRRIVHFAGPADAHAVLVQSNGKIVVGGASYLNFVTDFSLVRLMPDGTPDGSFSGDGKRTLDFMGEKSYDGLTDLARQEDGKLIAVGSARGATSSSAFAVARFMANGRLDPDFSGDGKRLIRFPRFDHAGAGAVDIQTDGKILVGGSVGFDDFEFTQFAMARLKADGTLDRSYGGGDGRVTTRFEWPSTSSVSDMVLQPDGKLVAVGQGGGSGHTRFAFARYNVDGTRDATFSGDGKLLVNADSNRGTHDVPHGLEVRPDGRIVAAGVTWEASDTPHPDSVALVRIRHDGKLDTTFTGDGRLVSTPLAEDVEVVDLDLVAGNKLVVTGYSQFSQGAEAHYKFFVARYNPGGMLDGTFGGGDGLVLTSFPGSVGQDTAQASTIQANGRIVVAGYSRRPNDYFDFAVARYLP
jgi:uncharacterized delta-60 repeat protein